MTIVQQNNDERCDENDQRDEDELMYELNDLKLYREFGDDFDFTLAIEYDELDEVISDRTEIVIRNKIRMFEDLDNLLTTDYHIIKASNHEYITLRDCIKQLIKQKARTTGEHQFFEGIYHPPGTPPYMFEIMFGS